MSSYSEKIHSFKSLVDECMWLFNVVWVSFNKYANYKKIITSFYKYVPYNSNAYLMITK